MRCRGFFRVGPRYGPNRTARNRIFPYLANANSAFETARIRIVELDIFTLLLMLLFSMERLFRRFSLKRPYGTLRGCVRANTLRLGRKREATRLEDAPGRPALRRNH